MEVYAHFPATNNDNPTMHIKHTLVAFTLSLGAITTGPLNLLAEAPPLLEVSQKQFGILIESKGGDGFSFVPLDSVPLVIGQQFGWMLKVKTDRSEIVVREEQTLAAPPSTFGDASNGSTISPDGRTCTQELTLEPDDDGCIFHFWEVAKGDPLGPASFRLFIDDQLVANLEFLFVNDINAADDIGVPMWPKQKHPPMPPFLEQQLERLKTAHTASEQYLMSTDTAIKITELRVQAAREGNDETELHTAETHLHTLTEERKNIEASTALLDRAMKEMEATIERRDAVARERAKSPPAAKQKPAGKPAPSGDKPETSRTKLRSMVV